MSSAPSTSPTRSVTSFGSQWRSSSIFVLPESSGVKSTLPWFRATEVLRHEITRSGVCSTISASHSSTFPTTLARQRRRLSSSCFTDSTPSMKCGNALSRFFHELLLRDLFEGRHLVAEVLELLPGENLLDLREELLFLLFDVVLQVLLEHFEGREPFLVAGLDGRDLVGQRVDDVVLDVRLEDQVLRLRLLLERGVEDLFFDALVDREVVDERLKELFSLLRRPIVRPLDLPHGLFRFVVVLLEQAQSIHASSSSPRSRGAERTQGGCQNRTGVRSSDGRPSYAAKRLRSRDRYASIVR